MKVKELIICNIGALFFILMTMCMGGLINSNQKLLDAFNKALGYTGEYQIATGFKHYIFESWNRYLILLITVLLFVNVRRFKR